MFWGRWQAQKGWITLPDLEVHVLRQQGHGVRGPFQPQLADVFLVHSHNLAEVRHLVRLEPEGRLGLGPAGHGPSTGLLQAWHSLAGLTQPSSQPTQPLQQGQQLLPGRGGHMGGIGSHCLSVMERASSEQSSMLRVSYKAQAHARSGKEAHKKLCTWRATLPWLYRTIDEHGQQHKSLDQHICRTLPMTLTACAAHDTDSLRCSWHWLLVLLMTLTACAALNAMKAPHILQHKGWLHESVAKTCQVTGILTLRLPLESKRALAALHQCLVLIIGSIQVHSTHGSIRQPHICAQPHMHTDLQVRCTTLSSGAGHFWSKSGQPPTQIGAPGKQPYTRLPQY